MERICDRVSPRLLAGGDCRRSADRTCDRHDEHNRYFIAAIKERIRGGPSPYPQVHDLHRAAQAQLLYNVVAWCGFSATAFATLTALLSLARYRDAFGAHLGPDLAIAALVVAGTSLPVLGLCERLLRQRLKRVGMGIDDLR